MRISWRRTASSPNDSGPSGRERRRIDPRFIWSPENLAQSVERHDARGQIPDEQCRACRYDVTPHGNTAIADRKFDSLYVPVVLPVGILKAIPVFAPADGLNPLGPAHGTSNCAGICLCLEYDEPVPCERDMVDLGTAAPVLQNDIVQCRDTQKR